MKKQLIIDTPDLQRMPRALWLTTLLVLSITLVVSGQSTTNALDRELKILRNLRYGDKPPVPYDSDTSSDRTLDLYLPLHTTKKKVPVFLYIHGGGFSGGDKSALSGLLRKLADRGFAVMSVNYRLYLKHHKTSGASARANMSKGLRANGKFHPAMQEAVQTATEDIIQVLSWIKEKSGEYPFDLKRVAIGGGSAGAMAALHVAYASGQRIVPIRAVVNFWGGLQDASIIQKPAPPLLTFHGEKDDLIHVDYAYALDRQMKKIGAVSETHIIKDKGHAIYKIIEAEYVDTIVNFLN
ncbi:alpha/beta hydrolase [Sphingobacterium sp. SGG-5]|uniref:alpha/beta hydrolase n=1 Tax=Sphingobacterium sp. SGG-5 TaxID=2710881 RepID=UPI0013EC323B|nr:alpha/beta hydrolase [Sphingobacterium sp. SGG-5]NGM63300.1 alpha/beta hydrolase [Sphingobacterium sp. SGG-5]